MKWVSWVCGTALTLSLHRVADAEIGDMPLTDGEVVVAYGPDPRATCSPFAPQHEQFIACVGQRVNRFGRH